MKKLVVYIENIVILKKQQSDVFETLELDAPEIEFRALQRSLVDEKKKPGREAWWMKIYKEVVQIFSGGLQDLVKFIQHPWAHS